MKASLVLALLPLFAAACGSDPPPPQEEFGVGSASPDASAAPAGSAAPRKTAAAAPSGIPPRREFPEAEFTETERSRDPFRSYTSKFAAEVKG
jgi:type IV pilus assembly protein PilP